MVSVSANSPEPVVLGATLDVALRLQASAAPGTVVISAATRSLVQRQLLDRGARPVATRGRSS